MNERETFISAWINPKTRPVPRATIGLLIPGIVFLMPETSRAVRQWTTNWRSEGGDKRRDTKRGAIRYNTATAREPDGDMHQISNMVRNMNDQQFARFRQDYISLYDNTYPTKTFIYCGRNQNPGFRFSANEGKSHRMTLFLNPDRIDDSLTALAIVAYRQREYARAPEHRRQAETFLPSQEVLQAARVSFGIDENSHLRRLTKYTITPPPAPPLQGQGAALFHQQHPRHPQPRGANQNRRPARS